MYGCHNNWESSPWELDDEQALTRLQTLRGAGRERIGGTGDRLLSKIPLCNESIWYMGIYMLASSDQLPWLLPFPV